MNETTQSAAFLREIGARFDDREAYAAALASVAELTRDRDAAIVALGEWARKAGALETRVAKLEEALGKVVEE
jgi:predicted TPR repeat methyltransferase